MLFFFAVARRNLIYRSSPFYLLWFAKMYRSPHHVGEKYNVKLKQRSLSLSVMMMMMIGCGRARVSGLCV